MKKWAEITLKYRWWFLALISVITLISFFGIIQLKVEGDIIKTLPSKDPVVSSFNEVGREFKGNLVGMVIIESEPDVFNRRTFKKMLQLTEEYRKIEGVTEVTSLVNTMDIKRTEEGIEVGNLIDYGYIPEKKEEYEELKRYVLSNERFKGQLVSNRGNYATIIIRLAGDVDRGKVGKEIIKITEKLKDDFKVYYAGFPPQIAIVNGMIINDIVKLIPIAILVLLLVLFLSFRSMKGVFLPLLIVVISVLWTVGFMGLMKVPFSIFSDILPVILLAVGSAYGIHMVHRYYEDIRSGDTKIEDIKKSIKKVGLPIFMAAITTCVGFLSLIFTQLDDIRKFGIFTGFGILVAMVLSLTLIPIMLSFSKVKKRKKGKPSFTSRIVSMDFFSILTIRGNKLVLIVALVIFLFSAAGIPALKRKVDMLNYFPEDSPIRVSENLVMKEFGGGNPLYVMVRTRNAKHPVVLKTLRNIQERLKMNSYINHPFSIANLITEMNRLLLGHDVIPGSEEKVENLYVLLEGEPSMEMLITGDSKKALVNAYINTNSTGEMKNIARYVDSIIKEAEGEYLYMEEDKIPSHLRTQLLSLYAKNYATLISQTYNLTDEEEKNIEKILLNGRLNQLKLSKDEEKKYRRSISKRIEAYLNGDESEILIESDVLKRRIAERIGRGEEVMRVLRNSLAPSMYENDRELLLSFAKSLRNIREEARREFITERLKSFIAQKYSIHDRKKLGDYIYEYFSKWIYVKKDELKDIIPPGEMERFIEQSDADSIHMEFSQTGFHLLYKILDDRLIRSQLQSLLVALILVFIMMAIKFRGIKGGAIAMVPVIFTIVVYLGIMGWTGIPLDIVTSLIGSLVIGMGIDYTIHIFSRLVDERKRKSFDETLQRIMNTTGRAVVINAFSVGAGFFILVFATLIPLRRFGTMIALSMFIATIGALLLLPSFIKTFRINLNKERRK